MKKRPEKRRGFWLLESMIAVAIFSIGMIALGQCVNNCLAAVRIKEEDARARLALANRMAEIEAGAVQLADSVVEELKEPYEGMRLKQTRVPVIRKNENEQDIVGIYAVTLELMWKSDGQELSRDLLFYAYPRPR
jgi:prepilin-type N-terminal cleavage/methylation domain-containing protein